MKTINNKRKFLALLLSLMMVSSVGAAFSSCVDDDSSSSSSTESSSSAESTSSSNKVDKGTIKNSNFNFTSISDTTLINTSISGWTRTVNSTDADSADASDSKSGVIDVTRWDNMVLRTKTDAELAEYSDTDAANAWDTLTVGDKLAYYEIWKSRTENADKTISDEDEGFEKYQNFNLKLIDLPYQDKYLEEDEDGDKVNKGVLQDGYTKASLQAANPGTHYDGSTTAAPDNQILMIHNNDTVGTAQKATSTTNVTVAAGTAAKFSVWVKTADLVSYDSNQEPQPAVDKGAYISVSHSVGGKSVEDYTVENIDTEEMGVTDNNGWKQYTFYLNSSSFVDTTFKIVLGLGQGSKSDKLGYVNGYAYFDDITYETISLEDFNTNVVDSVDPDTGDVTYKYPTVTLDEDDVRVYDSSEDVLVMDYSSDDWDSTSFANTLEKKVTESEDHFNLYDFDSTKDVVELKTKSELKVQSEEVDNGKLVNPYLASIYNNKLKGDGDDEKDFYKSTDKTLLILSSNGTPYTVGSDKVFTMDANTDYMIVSLYVKSFCTSSATGAGITLKQIRQDTAGKYTETLASFTSINTSTLDTTTVGDDEDYYDGWQRYYFFLEKDEDIVGETVEFKLEYTYGPTSITVNTLESAFSAGFAAFTKLETLTLEKDEYECAQANDFAKTVVFTTPSDEIATGNEGFDSVAGTPTDAIETGLANPLNYKGVYSDSAYVKTPTANNANSANRDINNNPNAGLINKEYFVGLNGNEGYYGANAEEVWNRVFEDAYQPLLIVNDKDATKSYGYIGLNATLSNDYTAVSVRVKTKDAVASVYLVDPTTLEPLSVTRELTYWYDDDGNVLTGDPEEDDTVIAFRRDLKTGLYKANAKKKAGKYVWSDYSKIASELINENVYFANLAAYTEKDGKLYANESANGQQYHKDMKTDWDHVVFYKHSDGAWYTEENGNGYKVIDFAKAYTGANSLARYNAIEGNEYQLAVEGIDTNGEWRTVTFYIRKGSTAQNYRLEVWSGTRDNATVNTTENGYVLFDTNADTVDQERYSTLLENHKDAKKQFEGVFSYYDTDKFVRYEEAKDTDNVGDLFETSFIASEYSEAVAYLYFNGDVEGTYRYRVFADYKLSDVKLIETNYPDIDDDTEDDDDTLDETTGEETNVWLLASSISVAVALLVAIGGIAGRRIWKFIQKKRAASVRPNIKK